MISYPTFFYIIVVIMQVGVGTSEAAIDHYYMCPQKVICQTLIDHYRLDPNKRLIFKNYRNLKISLSEYKKNRRLTGIAATSANLNFQKSNNVITLYDGVGVQGDPAQSTFQYGNFSFNLQYDLRSTESRLAPIENSISNEKVNVRQLIFNDLMQIFPRYSKDGNSINKRALFFYLNNLDTIKGYTSYLDSVKKSYIKVTNLYKRKAITIETLKRMSDLVVEASERLFEAQASMDNMYPDEFRLKAKLDLLKSAVETKEDLIISENLSENPDKGKVCSLIEFIERQEGMMLESLKMSFDESEKRLRFTYPQGLNINANGSFDNPSSLNASINFGVNYRLFDSTENYISRIMYRENKKDISQIFSDNKVKEFERVQVESQSFYQVKEFFNNLKFNYEQSKIFNKGLYKGSIFKNNLRIRDEGISKKYELMKEHLDRELGYKRGKAIFLSNIFRIKAICPIVDETMRDLE